MNDMGVVIAPAKPRPQGLEALMAQRYQEMLDDAVTAYDGSGKALQNLMDIMEWADIEGIPLDIERARKIANGTVKPDVIPSTSPGRNGAPVEVPVSPDDMFQPFTTDEPVKDPWSDARPWSDAPIPNANPGANMWDENYIQPIIDWWNRPKAAPGQTYEDHPDMFTTRPGGDDNLMPLDPWAQGIVPDPYDLDGAANPLFGVPGKDLLPPEPMPLDLWAQPGLLPDNEVTLTDGGRLSTTDNPLDIEVVPPADPAQEDIDRKSTELIQNDRDLGGDGFSENRPFAKSRAKVLDWLGHDEESGQRLGNSLMTMGGAILASDAGSWQGALGEGILAGRADYDDMKQDSIDNAAQRERLDMAQMEMEERRSDRQERRRQEGLDRAEAAVRGKLEGFTYDENNNMTGFSAEQRRQYAGITAAPYKPQSTAGKVQADVDNLASIYMGKPYNLSEADAYRVARAEIREYAGYGKAEDPLANFTGE